MPGKNSASKPKNKQVKKNENTEKVSVLKAHEQAEHDIEKDPDMDIVPEKGDDLDEGELARLEGEK